MNGSRSTGPEFAQQQPGRANRHPEKTNGKARQRDARVFSRPFFGYGTAGDPLHRIRHTPGLLPPSGDRTAPRHPLPTRCSRSCLGRIGQVAANPIIKYYIAINIYYIRFDLKVFSSGCTGKIQSAILPESIDPSMTADPKSAPRIRPKEYLIRRGIH